MEIKNDDLCILQEVLEKYKSAETRYVSSEYAQWAIASGGYDCWWELYYQGITVLSCIDGKIEGNYTPFQNIQPKVVQIVLNVFPQLGGYKS